jgi:hypothetical protein
MESTIFTYDGQDFIRKHTTLVTEDGKSAVNTKLDRDNPAYKALGRCGGPEMWVCRSPMPPGR